MNDEFESRIEQLARIVPMYDKTPQWKAEILAKARNEARAVPMRRLLPPMWLVFAWAAAWVGICLFGWNAHSLSQEVARAIPSTSPLDPSSQISTELLSHQLLTLKNHLTLQSELQ